MSAAASASADVLFLTTTVISIDSLTHQGGIVPMQDGDIELFFRFMGYGPIQTAKVWFIGIEPGGESHAFVKDQDRITVNGEELLYDASIPTPVGAERETRVWACSRQMAAALGVSDAFFMSNMAPLPRPSEANRHEGISGC